MHYDRPLVVSAKCTDQKEDHINVFLCLSKSVKLSGTGNRYFSNYGFIHIGWATCDYL